MKLFMTLLTPVLAITISSAYADSSKPTQSVKSFNTELREHTSRPVAYGYYRRVFGPGGSSTRSSSSYTKDKFRTRGGSELPSRINPPGERTFVFSPRLKAWAAYKSNGKRVGYGRANGGAHWCADTGRPCRTPRGEFRIRSKGAASCKSSKYPLPRGGAPMPYCMFFLSNYAIHGSPYISNRNSSHGCIRVENKAAYWLSNYFMKPGTRVIVKPY